MNVQTNADKSALSEKIYNMECELDNIDREKDNESFLSLRDKINIETKKWLEM